MTHEQPYATGIDVSQWQGNNFPFYRAAEEAYSFAYIRASVRTHQDPCYLTNHTRAIGAGLLTGSYHYLYPEPYPGDQARTFWQTLSAPDTPDALPPALDVEDLELNESHLLHFIAAWQHLTDAPLAIYTSKRAWHNIVDKDAQWPASLPLWVADWRGYDKPAIPEPWQHWTFWQHTSKGRIPGYTGPVDLNYYNGTAGHLRDHYQELWT